MAKVRKWDRFLPPRLACYIIHAWPRCLELPEERMRLLCLALGDEYTCLCAGTALRSLSWRKAAPAAAHLWPQVPLARTWAAHDFTPQAHCHQLRWVLHRALRWGRPRRAANRKALPLACKKRPRSRPSCQPSRHGIGALCQGLPLLALEPSIADNGAGAHQDRRSECSILRGPQHAHPSLLIARAVCPHWWLPTRDRRWRLP